MKGVIRTALLLIGLSAAAVSFACDHEKNDAYIDFYNNTSETITVANTAWNNSGENDETGSGSFNLAPDSHNNWQIKGGAGFYTFNVTSDGDSDGEGFAFSMGFEADVTHEGSCDFTRIKSGYPQETSNPEDVPYYIEYLSNVEANIYIGSTQYDEAAITFTWNIADKHYSQEEGEYLAAALADQFLDQLKELTEYGAIYASAFQLIGNKTSGSFDASKQKLTITIYVAHTESDAAF